MTGLRAPEVASRLDALADATRRDLLESLSRREADAGSLAREAGISRQAVARHLSVLAAAGLVRSRREGRRILHRTDPARVQDLADRLRAVAAGWDRRLLAVKAEAERRAARTPVP